MKITETKCDKCPKFNAKSYEVLMGREMDASGNGYENVWSEVDFCINCLINFCQKNPDIKIRFVE